MNLQSHYDELDEGKDIVGAIMAHINPLLTLKCTCAGFPEQYDVFYKGAQVGYLRLRHGCFTVEYPDCGGEFIYEAEPKGDGFFADDEREFYLKAAIDAIIAKLTKDELI